MAIHWRGCGGSPKLREGLCDQAHTSYVTACWRRGIIRDEAVTLGGPRFETPFSTSRPVSHMRELERDPSADPPCCKHAAIVGRGRLGTALAAALRDAGYDVTGPLGRGTDAVACAPGVVLLCVPDAEIARAAALITPGPLIGHCSGATGLDALGS